uniref:Uncharacterized protein n=1 Tax=Cucumis melo TaxID=3656 RepID=A0A9I9EEZ7_CUCME
MAANPREPVETVRGMNEVQAITGEKSLTRNSGDCRRWSELSDWTAWIISLMIDKVFGPEEHPKSAIPKLVGAPVER